MSIALDDRKPYLVVRPEFVRTLLITVRRMEIAWREHRQAALLRRINAETRADIGYSQDYIRADWENFASQYPDTIAPAVVVRRKKV